MFELTIHSGFTLFKELEILSKSPNLTEIELRTIFKNENDEPIPIEEIMVLFPNMKEFKISPSYFTMESFQKLSKLKFSNKFHRLRFGMIKNEFDPITFCNFLKENCDEETRFSLSFDSYDLQLRLLPRVKELIEGWETKNLKYFLL
uniref:Uncharacterized protein n=1 Tax=Panagrolaimus davidi TaxID=227884 RepID=A0A914PJ43_9BILA